MSRTVTVDFGGSPATTNKRKVRVTFPAPAAPEEPTRVFMRCKTHSYLHLRDGTKYAQFLTMDNGTIEVVRVDLVTDVLEPEVKADKKHGIKARPAVTKEVYRIWTARNETHDLEPHRYDFLKAVQNYHSSLLGRTVAAEREMRAILGLPALDTPKTDDEPLWDTPQAPKPEAKPTGAIKGQRQPREPREPRQKTEKAPGGYTLAALCAELKKDPTEARKALRKSSVQKPGGTWEWASAEAAAEARKVIEAI